MIVQRGRPRAPRRRAPSNAHAGEMYWARKNDRERWDNRHRTARQMYKWYSVSAVCLFVLALPLLGISWVVAGVSVLMGVVFLVGRRLVGRWVTVVTWRDRLRARRGASRAVNQYGIPSARARRRVINKAAWAMARQRSR